MSEYKKYIESLPKKELVDLICGTDDEAPLLIRDEPVYSRPQILWSLMKTKQLTLEKAEPIVEEMMNRIHGHKWDLIFYYDYFRFDVKKPSFNAFAAVLFLALIGACWSVYTFISLIISLF